ncbi:Phage tail sheath protein [compost metagenome]
MAYCSCGDAATVQDALTYRDAISGREIELIYGDFLFGEEERYATAVAAGHRALLDQTVGFHKTLSNVPVQGVTGVTAPISWDLQTENTEAGILNGAGITVLIQREGFRFWGNRTCSPEPMFAFESAVRTAQVLRDTIAGGMLWAIDKPLYPSLAIDILETINTKCDELRDAGYLLGARARLADDNTTTSLSNGQLRIVYDFTPVPPLEHLHLTQVITDDYFADFAATVAAG